MVGLLTRFKGTCERRLVSRIRMHTYISNANEVEEIS